MRDHDLSRLHIVAKVDAAGHDAMLETIGRLRDDVSVLEIRSFAASITAALTRQGRAEALRKLYSNLDRLQGVVDRVNAYVGLLHTRKLALNVTH